MESDFQSKVFKAPVCSHQDIWIEIFKRFPVKALCQFCCVCKSWKSLISSHLFIADHFSSNSTEKSFLLMNGRRNAHKPFALYRPEQPLPRRITFLHFPCEIRHRKPDPINFSIIDFIHGVACLVPPARFSEYAFLWNPLIHKYVSVPWPLIDERSCAHIGFGFDTSRSDFKLVSISTTWEMEEEEQPIYQLFSLQSGRWKQLSVDKIGFVRVVSRYNSCYINGAIHWYATRSRQPEDYIYLYELLVFDCEREVFRTLELPQELAEDQNGLAPFDFSANLYNFGGMLAVVKLYPHDDAIEVWVMEEYGVVSTWNLLFKIKHEEPISYWEHANLMIRDDGDIYTFRDVASLAPRNPSERNVKLLENRKSYHPINAYAFEESLFLMDQEKPSPRIEEKIVKMLSKGVL